MHAKRLLVEWQGSRSLTQHKFLILTKTARNTLGLTGSRKSLTMEVVSQLRIELYDEMQALPEGLRISFPDLAADFLAVISELRQATNQPSTAATQHRPLVPFQLPADALRPAGEDLNGASFVLSGACLASLQAELADEAAGTEAGATSADGWADVALSALSAVTQTKSHVGDRRSMPSFTRQLSVRPGPAHLLSASFARK
ncbi:hypothetical protein D9Q98_003891 [Chlorella vulgaris]|uniref:Uncharacterized protein n=2 Tax=Chlorella vulgaris TaxID=3077 RepID=A0A9D4TR19_CHLVU|nr:hypothetical protein D9Q98_003891 [Chlorella vulgaris]